MTHRWGTPPPPSMRGYGYAHTKRRRQILQDNPFCTECAKHGRQTRATVLDHKRPRCLGGTDKPANLQGLCRPCHLSKTGREGAHMRWHKKQRRNRDKGK